MVSNLKTRPGASEKRLTARQQSFVAHYLVTFHAAQSAKLAGYKATSTHSFESIGSENLTKPNIAKAIEEHFRMARMSAEEVLTELTKLARGGSKDQIKALALLSQHHGLLDGKPFVDQQELDRQLDIEIDKIHDSYKEQAREINAEIDDVKQKIKTTNDTFRELISVIRAEFEDDPPGLKALDRLREYFEAIVKGKEPPLKPEDLPTPEVEIIPPSRRLQPAAVERMMPEVVELQSSPAQPAIWCPPDRCFCPKT